MLIKVLPSSSSVHLATVAVLKLNFCEELAYFIFQIINK